MATIFRDLSYRYQWLYDGISLVSRSFRHPQKADLETVIMQGSLKEHDPSGEKIMTLTFSYGHCGLPHFQSSLIHSGHFWTFNPARDRLLLFSSHYTCFRLFYPDLPPLFVAKTS